MPSYHTHLVIAAISALMLFGMFSDVVAKYPEFLMSLPIFFVYTLLPDVDIPSSVISNHARKFFVVGGILSYISYYFYPNFYVLFFCFFCGIMIVAMTFAAHRKFFHSFLAGVILSIPLLFLGFVWFLSGFLGYSIHLLADRYRNE